MMEDKLTEYEEIIARRYRKMIRGGVPTEEVREKMAAAQVSEKVEAHVLSTAASDESVYAESTTDNSQASRGQEVDDMMQELEQEGGDEERHDSSVTPVTEATSLTDDEEAIAAKYRKMLKMGLHPDAVANKMTMDEVEPHIASVVLAGANAANDDVQPQSQANERRSEERENAAESQSTAPTIVAAPPPAAPGTDEEPGEEGDDGEVMEEVEEFVDETEQPYGDDDGEEDEQDEQGEEDEQGEDDEQGQRDEQGEEDEQGEYDEQGQRDEQGEEDEHGQRDDLGEEDEQTEEDEQAEEGEIEFDSGDEVEEFEAGREGEEYEEGEGMEGERDEEGYEDRETEGYESEEFRGEGEEGEEEYGETTGKEVQSDEDGEDDGDWVPETGYNVEGIFVNDDDETPPIVNNGDQLDHVAGVRSTKDGTGQNDDEQQQDGSQFQQDSYNNENDDDQGDGEFQNVQSNDLARQADEENQERYDDEMEYEYEQQPPPEDTRLVRIDETPVVINDDYDAEKGVTTQEQARGQNNENDDDPERRRHLLGMLVGTTGVIAFVLVAILVVLIVWLLNDDDGSESTRATPLSPPPATQPTRAPALSGSTTAPSAPSPMTSPTPSPATSSTSSPATSSTPSPATSPTPEGPFWRSVDSSPLTFDSDTSTGYGRSLAWAGDVIVTGLPRYSLRPGAGAAQAYERSGDLRSFRLEKFLTDRTEQSESFGSALDMAVLSEGGTVALLVGAPDTRGTQSVEQSAVSFGSAYYYESDGAGGWNEIGGVLRTEETLVEAGGKYGEAVALAAEIRRVVIASPSSSVNFSSVNNGRVFTYEYNGTDWQEAASPLIGLTDGFMGTGLDMSADGDELVVGSPGVNEGAGLMEYFVWNTNSSAWDLIANVGGLNQELFGATVAIIEDLAEGIFQVAVGGPGYNTDQGVVRVYGYDNGGDSISTFGQIGNDIVGNPGEEIGTSLSGKGGRLAIGTALGTFQVYEFDGTSWVPIQANATSTSTFSPVQSIAMADDGLSVAVGQKNAVTVFDLVEGP